MEQYTTEDLKRIAKSPAFFRDVILLFIILTLCVLSFQKGEWKGMNEICQDDEMIALDTYSNKPYCFKINEEVMNDEIQLQLNELGS